MYRGRSKLDTLVITDVEIHLTARGLEIRAQGALRGRDLKRPQANVSFVQTDWDHEVVDKAIELLNLMERSSSMSLMDREEDVPEVEQDRGQTGSRGGEEADGTDEDDFITSLGGRFPGREDTQF